MSRRRWPTHWERPILLHPDDHELWSQVHPDRGPDGGSPTASSSTWAGPPSRCSTRRATPGLVCLYDAAGQVVFSGDTLFRGGPGATGRSFSDFPTIVASIRDRLLVLPAGTGCVPDTAPRPPSATRRRTCRSGWREVIDPPTGSRSTPPDNEPGARHPGDGSATNPRCKIFTTSGGSLTEHEFQPKRFAAQGLWKSLHLWSNHCLNLWLYLH